MISVNPQVFRFSIWYSNIGLPQMLIIGLGTSFLTEAILVPLPPAIITVFIIYHVYVSLKELILQHQA